MKLIICMTGMPGSGKSVAGESIRKKGFTVLSVGDAVRKEMQRQSLTIKIQTLEKFSIDTREKFGKDYAIRLLESEIESFLKKNDIVFVEGIRTMNELDRLKALGYKIVSLSFISDKELRFKRMLKRDRGSDPKDFDEFLWREKKQLEMGIAEVIVTADYFVQNNGGMRAFKLELLSKVKRIISEQN